MSEIDFEAEGLVAGLTGPDRQARLDLLAELVSVGVPLERLRTAVAEDRLAFLPVEHFLAGEGLYTEAELFEQVDADEDFLRRYWQAIGFTRPDPDERIFNERDVDSAKRLSFFHQAGLPDEPMLDVARIMGEAMARVADAVRDLVSDAFLADAENEAKLGLRYAQAARHLAPELEPVLGYVFQKQLTQQIRNDMVSFSDWRDAPPGSRNVAIGFADLVGFTQLGARLDNAELGAVARQLAVLASEVAKAPVRLVKTLGDGVMLASFDVDALLQAMLSLVESAAAQGEDFPPLRAGVATGLALSRGGDWFGHTVNVASRITDLARAGSVVTTRETRVGVRDKDYDWSFIGEHRLKGVPRDVRLFRVRNAAPTA